MDKTGTENTTLASGAGMMYKAAAIEPLQATEDEMKKINKCTLEPLDASEVFTFSAVLCDNEIDRQYEQFTLKALRDLKKLFIGKTVIKDHKHLADNQIARIYDTELVTTDKTTSNGQPYTQLKANIYMVRTKSNKDLITEIKAGIKKEGSVGFRTAGAVCSVCGTDNTKSYCAHFPGQKYTRNGAEQTCTFELTGATDAFEFSLCAVPAQRQAGVSKSYTGETVAYKDEAQEDSQETVKNVDRERELQLRADMAALNIFI